MANTMKKSTHSLVAALAVFVLNSAGSAGGVTLPAGVVLAERQELTRQVPTEVESLDPAYIESWTANGIGLDLFEGLTRIDAAGQVVPGVALSWERKSPVKWLFKLRHDAKWSNGQPVTAADFVYAWRRVVDPKTSSKYTVLVEFVKNAKAIIAGKAPLSSLGVRAADPYTLEVETEVAAAFFPELTAMPTMAPVPQNTVMKTRNWTRPQTMVSNGAYRLADWQPNNRIVLLKNDQYWNARQLIVTKVTYLPVESDETALRMYQAGQIDYTYSIPSGLFAQLNHQFGADLRRGLQIATYYYYVNNNDPAFQDKRVRQALSMVLDRDILTAKLTQGGERPMFGLMPTGIKGARPYTSPWAAWPMAQRVAFARSLMQQAGYSAQKPLTLTLTYNTNDLHKKVALFAAYEWRTKLGINVKLENVEFKVLMSLRHDSKVQLARDGWFADYNDAMTFFDLLRCGGAQNTVGYCNPKVDALIREANQALDNKTRTDLLTQAHALAMNDYPLLPLFQYSADRLVKYYVGGYVLTNYVDQRASQDLYLLKH